MPSPQFLTRLHEQIERQPEATAVSSNGTTWTYLQLGEEVRLAKDHLDSLTVNAGDRLCLRATKTPYTLALLVAAWLRDCTVLLPSYELGSAATQSVAVRSGASRVLTSAPAEDGSGPSYSSTEIEPAPEAVMPTDSLLMLTTSGSTGIPKIVPLSPAGVDAFLGWASERFDIGPGAAVLSYAPLNFDLSLLDVWTSLAYGALTVLIDSAAATDPHRLIEAIAGHQVSVVQAVPMMFRLLGDQTAVFGTVEHVVSTGEGLPASLIAKMPDLFPHARVYNVYGCTETNDSTIFELDAFELAEDVRLPIGRPLPGVRVHLVDPMGAIVTGPGEGELWVSTPFQAKGYLDPALTAERFVRDPAGSETIFYRSGDMVGRDADQMLAMLGRTDFHVKVRGVRTNTAEVEHVIQSHPDVLEAAVVAVPDGTEGNVLLAFIGRRPGSALNSLTMRQVCAQRLARTAIPTRVEISDSPLPKTSTGKIDRSALRTRYLEESPCHSSMKSSDGSSIHSLPM